MYVDVNGSTLDHVDHVDHDFSMLTNSVRKIMR